jgi:hypothetical protein
VRRRLRLEKETGQPAVQALSFDGGEWPCPLADKVVDMNMRADRNGLGEPPYRRSVFADLAACRQIDEREFMTGRDRVRQRDLYDFIALPDAHPA